jgi:hypothetical protein
MTATLDRTATPVPVPVAIAEKGSTLRRRAAAGSLLGAAAISFAGFLATPWEGGSGTASYLRSLVEHPRQGLIAAVLLHFGYLLFVPAAFAMARMARRGAPVLAAVGITLSVLGAGLSGLLVTDVYDLSIARHLGTAAAVPISDMEGVPAVGFAAVSIAATTAIGAILGLVALAAAMRRARLAPLWPTVGILVGFGTAFGAHGMLRACGGFAAVAVSLAFLGITVLRMSDERFEYGSDPR